MDVLVREMTSSFVWIRLGMPSSLVCRRLVPFAGVHKFRAAVVPCLYVPVMDYEDVSKEYSWQMPPAAGELFWIAREEAVRPFDFKRNGDPRCTAAFGEPFKSCSDLQPFAYTSEHAFVVSLLKARPDLLAAGVLGKIRVDAVSSQDVGWDFLWTEFDMLGADAYILVSEDALLAT